MLIKGDRISILPEYRNKGDELYIWVVVDDEEKGWVNICPLNKSSTSLRTEAVPTYVVKAKRTAAGRKVSIFMGPLKHLANSTSQKRARK